MTATPPLSPRMLRELRAIDLAPRSIWGHLRLRDISGPTASALLRRGLIRLREAGDTKLELTEARRAVVERTREQEPA